MQPDYLFVGVFLAVYLFSLLLIILQSKYGSRCFIPKFLKPKPFQYLRKIKIDDSSECPICLNSLHLSPTE